MNVSQGASPWLIKNLDDPVDCAAAIARMLHNRAVVTMDENFVITDVLVDYISGVDLAGTVVGKPYVNFLAGGEDVHDKSIKILKTVLKTGMPSFSYRRYKFSNSEGATKELAGVTIAFKSDKHHLIGVLQVTETGDEADDGPMKKFLFALPFPQGPKVYYEDEKGVLQLIDKKNKV